MGINDGTGDTVPDAPSESEYSMEKFDDLVAAIESVKSIGNEQFKSSNLKLALKKYRKAVRYINHFLYEKEGDGVGSSDEDDSGEGETNKEQNRSEEELRLEN